VVVSPAVFVSPHLDDAVLSCACGICRLVAGGTAVTVCTVCTADPPPEEPLSTLARRNHAAWGLGDAPFERRRREDAAALAGLGARPLHLGFNDAIYRRGAAAEPLYDRPVGVPILAEDRRAFLPALRDALAEALDAELVFCPAGVGGHVDHLLVREAVEALCDPVRLVYYEEFPYSARDGAQGWAGAALTPTAEELEARAKALASYRSQLRGLFPTRAERLLEILSARLLGGRPLLGPDDVPPRRRLAAHLERRPVERYRAAVSGTDAFGTGPPDTAV
jgi:LmbE family N-acetylglucosaminyl deacetylase